MRVTTVDKNKSVVCSLQVSEGKLRKLWDSVSELRSSLCERRMESTVLWPAPLPVKTTQITQFLRQVRRQTLKSLSLTEIVYRPLRALSALSLLFSHLCCFTLLKN